MYAFKQAYFYLFWGKRGYYLLSLSYWLGLSSIFIDNQYQLQRNLCLQSISKHLDNSKHMFSKYGTMKRKTCRGQSLSLLSIHALLVQLQPNQLMSYDNHLAIYILIMLLRNWQKIKGLKYIKDFITDSEKERILTVINSNRWCDRLRRRQQYYGIKYFQTAIEDQVLQPKHSTDHYSLSQLHFLIEKSTKSFIFQQQNPPNQILVNRYHQHDRLGLHVEDPQAFGEIIMGLSLGSSEYLRLVNVDNPQHAYLLELEDKSCYVLSEEARYDYRHGIGRVRDSEKYKADGFERISLTIRHVIDTRRKIQKGKTNN